MGSENKKTASSAPPARNGPILLLIDSSGAAENLLAWSMLIVKQPTIHRERRKP
jgi:hypothetical protein